MSGIIDFRTPAAGFDQPIEMWLACHERVMRIVNLLVRLRDYLAAGEGRETTAVTAASIVRYFDEAAPRHHEDEEVDLFPRLLARTGGAERERLAHVIDELRVEHADLDALWTLLRERLVAIEARTAVVLDADLVDEFAARHERHVKRENAVLAPAFRRTFAPGELDAIGRSMAARRGVDWERLVAAFRVPVVRYTAFTLHAQADRRN